VVAPEATQVRVAPPTDIVSPALAVSADILTLIVAGVAAPVAVPSPSWATPQVGTKAGPPIVAVIVVLDAMVLATLIVYVPAPPVPVPSAEMYVPAAMPVPLIIAPNPSLPDVTEATVNVVDDPEVDPTTTAAP